MASNEEIKDIEEELVDYEEEEDETVAEGKTDDAKEVKKLVSCPFPKINI